MDTHPYLWAGLLQTLVLQPASRAHLETTFVRGMFFSENHQPAPVSEHSDDRGLVLRVYTGCLGLWHPQRVVSV